MAPPIVLPPAVAAPPIVAPVAAQLGPPVVSVQGTTLESISVDAVMEDLTLDVGAVMSFQNKQQVFLLSLKRKKKLLTNLVVIGCD